MSSFLKCKMCGGDLRIISGLNIAECEYCGTRQSVPKTPDERKTSYFNRANEARRANEFDKAIGIYESIVVEYPDEAEAYWGLCLCKFGIEYVDDPKTGQKIPTCHRTVFDSIFEDKDYLSAISNGDMDQTRVYKQEAAVIDKIQKSIIKSVSMEKPYDVFICYKESDEVTGKRTRDSVLAQDVYDRLVAAGFKTFFAKITLEDKVGAEYEPYIFSALYSAKVMVVIGTSGTNLDAVWVRNEWSRFLSLMKKDNNKTLLPCYMDMNPSDMPTELASLQAYDMSAMGFMQDLIRGVSKILGTTRQTVANNNVSVGSDAEKLIKRGMLAVESKEWKQAEQYFEQALNDDPEAAQAYWGKVLCEKRVSAISDLLNTSSSLNTSDNYLRALRFAAPDFKRDLLEYEKKIQRRLSIIKERKRKRGKNIFVVSVALALCTIIVICGIATYNNFFIPNKNYKMACELYNSGDYANALTMFENLGVYKDSTDWIEKCKIGVYGEERYELMTNCKVGLRFTLGSFYSDAITVTNSNTLGAWDYDPPAPEPIDWTIIKVEDGRALAISTYIIDYTPAYKGQDGVKKVEEKLNSAFINEWFSKTDLQLIDKSNIPGERGYNKSLFILDEKDVSTIPQELRRGEDTDYVKTISAIPQFFITYNSYIVYPDNDTNETFSYVDQNGDLRTGEEYLNAKRIGIRPAIWIKLGSTDSATKLKKEPLKNLTTGDAIEFGNNEFVRGSNPDSINNTWIVLEKTENRLLLISKTGVVAKQYGSLGEWKESEVRAWLNDEYFNKCFSEEEQAIIINADITTDGISEKEVTTQDKVWLLSVEEAEEYYKTDTERKCLDKLWWLRSSGYYSSDNSAVREDGSISETGVSVKKTGWVRPAIYIDISD